MSVIFAECNLFNILVFFVRAALLLRYLRMVGSSLIQCWLWSKKMLFRRWEQTVAAACFNLNFPLDPGQRYTRSLDVYPFQLVLRYTRMIWLGRTQAFVNPGSNSALRAAETTNAEYLVSLQGPRRYAGLYALVQHDAHVRCFIYPRAWSLFLNFSWKVSYSHPHRHHPNVHKWKLSSLCVRACICYWISHVHPFLNKIFQ
jgi:hypothetical protein